MTNTDNDKPKIIKLLKDIQHFQTYVNQVTKTVTDDPNQVSKHGNNEVIRCRKTVGQVQ